MKAYISPYELEFQRGGGNLQGALLMFEFQSDLRGFCDFLPRPRFGERSFQKQMADFKKGRLSCRLKILKDIALCDALARREKRSLFFSLKVPESHFLIEDKAPLSLWEEISKAGYKVIKVKLKSRSFQEQTASLRAVCQAFPHFRYRLDLNGRLKPGDWPYFRKSFKFLWNHIEFIEDPFDKPLSFVGDGADVFAQDWIVNPRSCIRVVKPSRDFLQRIIKDIPARPWKKIVFTHSQETLLGQAVTAWSAGVFYRKYPRFRAVGAFKCFSFKKSRWTSNGDRTPFFKPPAGFGLGFGYLLEKEPWIRWI